MRAVGVVVLHILTQHDVEVAWSGDQEVVEAFPAQGADEALRDRVRPGCPDRGANDADVGAGEHGVERGAHARQRGPGERANAQLKSWRILRKIRSCPHRATSLVKAVLVLILAG